METIVALATPAGNSGVAIIRVSGDNSLSLLKSLTNENVEFEPRKMYLKNIFLGEITDKCLVVYFKSPFSFTGEDVVEIQSHGGYFLAQKIIDKLVELGARIADRGEFSKRAFINGKMTLTGAEALGELLSASSDDQITLARSGLDGRLSAESERIYNSLCDILAAIYAHIDYPDEDLADIPRDEMLRVARENLSALEILSRTYSTAHAIGEGIPTVILGRTNAGKSTLYNRIVGRDAAIVTDIEGTTRDVLTETAHLGRVTLRLSDTAGLRETDDKVESIGIERARREAENAELILFVLDSSRTPDGEDRVMIDYISTLAGIKVALLNKSDINTNIDFSSLLSSFALTLPISAESGYGFDKLETEIEKIYIDNELDMGQGAIIANARQNAAVTNAISALSGAISAIEGDLPLEICCVEVENSLSALGELDGRTVTEDIISKIFANFCVGK